MFDFQILRKKWFMVTHFEGLKKALMNIKYPTFFRTIVETYLLNNDNLIVDRIRYEDDGIVVEVFEDVEELPSEEQLNYEIEYEGDDYYRIKYAIFFPYEKVIEALLKAIKYGDSTQRKVAVVVLRNWLGEKGDILIEHAENADEYESLLNEILQRVN